jgi:hypothetical protein
LNPKSILLESESINNSQNFQQYGTHWYVSHQFLPCRLQTPNATPLVPDSLWIYAPVKGPSILFAVLFFISGILHVWQNNIKHRSFRIGFLLPWAAALFVAGFALREYGAWNHHYLFISFSKSNSGLGIYIASTVLLFCAPPVYAGANYFIFGRILYYIPYLSPLHPGRVWTTFIGLDSIVEILAANGASKAANSAHDPSLVKVGIALVKASLLLQIVLFLAFITLVVIFHLRCLHANVFSYRVKVIIYTLYVSSVLILLRNTFRTATFFYPVTAYANTSEWCFWVFEAVPMVLNTYVMNVYPPAKYLPANHKIYLATDGKTEHEGPGAVDKRPFLVTLFDPFDFVGLVKGRDAKNRFWEEDGIGGPVKSDNGDPENSES